MSITIKTPEEKNPFGGPISAIGTKVFNEDGVEIKNIESIQIDWDADSVLMATIRVDVQPGTTLENVHALLGTETLEQIASMHGYELVEKERF